MRKTDVLAAIVVLILIGLMVYLVILGSRTEL